MTLADGIKTLREEDFTDDEIIENIRKLRPDLNEGIDTLSKEGFSPEDIVENISTMKLGEFKIGNKASAAAGVLEGVAGPFAISGAIGKQFETQQPEDLTLQRDVEANILDKPFEDLSFAEMYALTDDDLIPPTFGPKQSQRETQDPSIEDPVGTLMSSLPRSKDQTSRRIREAGRSIGPSTPFGPLGVAMGLVGSQAGQTVREMFGEDGESQGWKTETGAIVADIVGGGLFGAGEALMRGQFKSTSRKVAPEIFKSPSDYLSKKSIRSVVQGEQKALKETVSEFGKSQLQNFEKKAADVTPIRFSELPTSSVAPLKEATDEAFRSANLNMISPIEATVEEGGTLIQNSAKNVFEENVINAERQAYDTARQEAENLAGTAPKTLEKAKKLRDEMTAVTPNPEQDGTVQYLNTLIRELEETIPEQVRPASNILDASGNPVTEATTIPSRTVPKNRAANELIELVKNGNQAVNYSAEARLQSHRLKPIISQLREEVGVVLDRSPKAKTAYQKANALHAGNSDIWGTKFMKNVRFAENPESIVTKSKTPSNLRNFTEAMSEQAHDQALLERLVVEDITAKGSSGSNKIAIDKLRPVLSDRARSAADNMINIKNPLTTEGGRTALRNNILGEVAESIQNGTKPQKSLNLMKTKKGYTAVRESLSGTSEGRQAFKSMERLFIEDLFADVMTSSGEIDFTKAKEIIKNPEIRQVVKEIAGDKFISSINELEQMSKNLERNLSEFAKQERPGFLKDIQKNIKNAGTTGLVLHALHVPWEYIGVLGLLSAGGKVAKAGVNRIVSRILKNPKAMNAIRGLSKAKTAEDLGKGLIRVSKDIESIEEEL